MIINSIDIYRPDDTVENYVYEHVKNKFCLDFVDGKYIDSQKISRILNSYFAIYEDLVNSHIMKLCSKNYLEFLLIQYEVYAEVEYEYKQHKLSVKDERFWTVDGSLSRRSIKYLIELTCSLSNEKNNIESGLSRNELEFSCGVVFAAAEEMVRTYMSSESSHSIFPENSVLTISKNKKNYMDYKTTGSFRGDFDIRKDTIAKQKIIGRSSYLTDYQSHNEILRNNFENYLGVDYQNILSFLQGLPNICSPINKGEGVYFIDRGQLLAVMSERFMVTVQQATLILDGLSIKSKNLEGDYRKIYNPKQEYRLLRRTFIVYPAPEGEHVAYSKNMLSELLLHLVNGLVFKKLPLEWINKEIRKDLDLISNKAGSWFERVVEKELNELKIKTIQSVKKIKLKGEKALFIPQQIGEIDILGYSEIDKAIVVIECKLISHSTEPKYFRNDIDQFVGTKKSYSTKFKAKYEWVLENKDIVIEYLNERFSCEITADKVCTAMVTHNPTIASEFISEFSCVSIAKLITSYIEKESWPFSFIKINEGVEVA